MTPLVSICIPAYLQTQYLKQTIESVAMQDFDDYEVIITDDSPDDSVENLVKQFEGKISLNYFRNKTPLGSPANWNQAIRKSCGKYIKILHHDDWLASTSSLGEFVKLLDENPEAGFAFSGATAKVAESNKAWHHFASNSQISQLKEDPAFLFLQNVIGPPSSTIIRRSSFVEFDENLVWLVDIAQYISILNKTRFVATQKPLIVSTTQAPHQITNSCTKNSKVNIFEHFYLFSLFEKNIPVNRQYKYINKLLELILLFNIRSVKEIRHAGYEGNIPDRVLKTITGSFLLRLYLRNKFRITRKFSALCNKIDKSLRKNNG